VYRGSGLRHGMVCSECQGKGYRLREMTEPAECAVCELLPVESSVAEGIYAERSGNR
jgi:hypothetical protein